MIASVYTNPAFVGLVVALPPSLLGWLGYRRARRVDAVAAQVGVATVESGSIGQAFEGLNKLNVALQVDNENFRDDREALEKCRQELAELAAAQARLPLSRRLPETPP